VSDVVEELLARARRAKRAKDIYDEEIVEIRKLLPVVRAEDPKKYGPRKLEEMILGLQERGTISRLTADAVGKSRKKPDD
jgi:hypothetical protein